MAKITIDKRVLDPRVEGTVTLEGEAFAYLPISDRGRPAHVVFTEPHRRQVKWNNDSPLRTLVDAKGYQLPPEMDDLLALEPDLSGHHGDAILRFDETNLTLMPVSDLRTFLLKDEEFLRACGVLFVDGEYRVGSPQYLKDRGAEISTS